MADDQVSVDSVPEQRFDGGCVGGRFEPVEPLVGDVAEPGRESETEEVEQSEDEVGVSGGVGGVLDNGQFDFVVEEFVEDMGCVTNGGSTILEPYWEY